MFRIFSRYLAILTTCAFLALSTSVSCVSGIPDDLSDKAVADSAGDLDEVGGPDLFYVDLGSDEEFDLQPDSAEDQQASDSEQVDVSSVDMDQETPDSLVSPDTTDVFDVGPDLSSDTNVGPVPLTEIEVWEILDYRFTNDQDAVVVLGDLLGNRVVGLFVVPLDGSPVITLTPNVEKGDPSLKVKSFQLTASGRVVFIGDIHKNGVDRLYSVRLDGQQLAVLSDNSTVDATLDVTDFKIAPNATWIAFRGDTRTDGVIQLFSVNVDGTNLTLLSHDTTDPLLDVSTYQICPDGKRVVFQGDTELSGLSRLYSNLRAGGGMVTLSHNKGTSTLLQVSSFVVGPHNSCTVVFWGDTEVNSVYRLYSIQPTGVGAKTLSLNTGTSTTLRAYDGVLTPAGDKVIYRGDVETNLLIKLYSVPVDGGSTVQLSPPTANTLFGVQATYKVSPDGQYALFRGDFALNSAYDLYVSPLATGKPVRVSQELTATNLVISQWDFTPDSQRVVFMGDADFDGNLRLYSVLSDGQSLVTLSPNSDEQNPDIKLLNVAEYWISPDNQHVLFRGDMTTDKIEKLYLAKLDGTGLKVLWANPDANDGQRPGKVRFSKDGSVVLFSLYNTEGALHFRIHIVDISTL